MYPFHSLAEMPVRSQGRSYSIMIGVTRLENAMADDGFDFASTELNLLLFDRDPRKSVYIQNVAFDQALAFFHLAHEQTDLVADLFMKYSKQGAYAPVSIAHLVNKDHISLEDRTVDFPLVPSIEPFILPGYVESQMAFRDTQYARRIRPYLALREAVGLPVDEGREWARWTGRNAAFARLLYVIRGNTPHGFKPVKFCEHESHYWDWFVGKSGKLYVRSVYVVSDDPDNPTWLERSQHPTEYQNIPRASCPNHNPLIEIGSGTYEAHLPVSNIYGVHARPATEISKAAMEFHGDVIISNGAMTADAKNPMEIFRVEAVQGSVLGVTVRGAASLSEARGVYHQIYRAANNELN